MNTVHSNENSASSALSCAEEVAQARLAAGGDERAFDQIMRRYNQRLFRIARSIVGEDNETEDVLQETYISACIEGYGFGR